jgi:hypothetical protein
MTASLFDAIMARLLKRITWPIAIRKFVPVAIGIRNPSGQFAQSHPNSNSIFTQGKSAVHFF